MTLFKKGILIMAITLFTAGCQGKTETEREVSVFPYPDTSFVGDPMPYYDGKEMNIFFLEDQRVSTIGYHPWSRYTTRDFTSFDYKGEVIPYGPDITAQDIALGTGSVIKDQEGVYHAFYTGHNDTYSPKEGIMHATSSDMQEWNKIPEDTFYAQEHYSKDDFRDPYVFWNEEEKNYWMLITTRKNNTGVIALYKSVDLKIWKDEGVLFENDMGSDSNLECPTLIEWKGYWYLSFSDQWPDRLVHYRVSENPQGPFNIPDVDYFDGNGFYAGRIEKMEDSLYLVGWNPTKENHMDEKNYNWAGNLVTHELVQQKNGELKVKPVSSVVKAINQRMDKKKVVLNGQENQVEIISKIEGTTKITGIIQPTGSIDYFGFAFNTLEDGYGILNFVFDVSNGEIGFFNKRTDTISSYEPQSTVKFDFAEKEKIPFTILIDNTTACLYVGDEIALSARMYGVHNKDWSIFGNDANVTINKVEIYTP